MSTINDDSGNSKFPKSSRFFSQNELPDLKSFQVMRNNRQATFNSQATNINYNPFNSPQQKSKSNFPLDFFHLSNKITLTDLPQENEFPTIKVDESEAQDPIKLIEKYKEEGKIHGAIKIILPESVDSTIKSNFQINSDLFWFQTNKLLNNSSNDELQNRLKFHKELVKFHLNNPNKKPINISKNLNSNGKQKQNNTILDSNTSDRKETTSSGITPPLKDNSPSNDDRFRNLTEIQIASILTGIEPSPQTDQIINENNTPLSDEISQATPTPNVNMNITETHSNASEDKNKTLSEVFVTDDKNNQTEIYSSNENANQDNLQVKSSEKSQIKLENVLHTTSILQKKGELHDNDTNIKKAEKKDQINPGKQSIDSKKLPSFLHKLPMIDKRPLDLYKLFRSVLMRGGFMEVINKKLWAQIGRELGYKGKIMTSLSSSLKSSYLRILYPFELYLEENNYKFPEFIQESNSFETSDETNENSKRPLKNEFIPTKKKILRAPLIIGSSKEFKRSIKSRSSKGFLLNSPHLIDIKQPNSIVIKPDDEVKIRNKRSMDIIESPILPQTQLNHALRTMYVLQSVLQDDLRSKSNGKFASIYSLRQFMEKDLKFQEYIIQNNNPYFNKISTTSSNFLHFNEPNVPVSERNVIKFEMFEELYWNFVQSSKSNDFIKDGIELENGVDISNSINGSGFAKLGDEFINYKNTLNNININSTICKNTSINSGASNNGNVETTYFNSKDYSTKSLEASLNPWNLHNLPILPNSLLGALSDSDLNNPDLVNTRLNIGMTFSTENWSKEDHFTQLCNYQFFGAYKKWYFIPESEFEKFEKLILEINETGNNRVNINNGTWNIDKLFENMIEDGIEHDTLMNSLENMINPISDIRLKHSNEHFQKLIDKKTSSIRYNQEYLITPQMLDERGIKYTSTIQKPGEMIIKYPKTFSSTLSFGMNLSEEVNFATELWLDYASEGEKLLSKESIIPNFSTFKLIVNLINLYDSGKNIGFNSDIYAKIRVMYDTFYKKELEIRKKVRKLISFKELIIDEKFSGELDLISDDELVDTFPSKVVLTDIINKQSFILSLNSFLEIHEEKTISFEQFKIELHLVYSDDKLKSFAKILHGYSINFDNWMKNYEKLMNENSEVSLKLYKSLLLEGEKIYSAISSSSFLSRSANKDDYDSIKLNTFKSYIENLKVFLEESNQFIDSCQSILALKHQQRIRNGNGNEFQSLSNGLEKLISLIKKIPTLNFSCPEIDQILELKVEIENFEKASRMLLSKQSKNISEFEDLINLGESFGITLPSLDFLIRIRDRMKWITCFEVIENGGDPYSDKKEMYSLQNLRDFFNEGIRVLGNKDIGMIEKIKSILDASENFNQELTKFLGVEFDNEISMDQLNNVIDNLKSNNLFIDLKNYNRIFDLQSNSHLINSFNIFSKSDKKLPYNEAKQLQTWILDSNLNFRMGMLEEELNKANSWISSIWELLKDLKTTTLYMKEVYPEELNTKLTLHSELVHKMCQMIYNIDYLDKNDIYLESSSYLAKFNKDSEITQKFYCICRDFEFGTMVGCDRCNEWYHIQCLQDYDQTNNDEHYICPICKLVDCDSSADCFLNSQVEYTKLQKIQLLGEDLKIIPTNEKLVLETLMGKAYHHIIKLEREVNSIKLLEKQDLKIDQLMFILRKLYGFPIRKHGSLDAMLRLLLENNDNKGIILSNETNNSLNVSDIVTNKTLESTEDNRNTLDISILGKIKDESNLKELVGISNEFENDKPIQLENTIESQSTDITESINN